MYQVLTERLEARAHISYAKLWYGLYKTNLLSNANWGNITDHRNWLMPPANGIQVFHVNGVSPQIFSRLACMDFYSCGHANLVED